jgi:hypothetical protein
MAMPPGGGSSWAHSSDSYQILDEHGAAWAQLNVPLTPASIRLTIRSSHSASEWHFLIDVAAKDGGAMWTYHHPRLPGGRRRLVWTAETPVEQLVPHPDVFPRGQFGRMEEDALPIATVEARAGEVALVDARGATRLVIRLGAAPDPAWPAGERGVVAAGETTIACFCLPTGERMRVHKVAVSLP